MEPHLTHPHPDPQTQSVGLHSDEYEHHHEKKSVIKKVKDKAKKIKDTVTKHGHGHEHGDEHPHYDDDEDEEDPEVHGAPIYESAAIRGADPGLGYMGQPGSNLEKPTAMGEDRYTAIITEPPTKPFGAHLTTPPAVGIHAPAVDSSYGQVTGGHPRVTDTSTGQVTGGQPWGTDTSAGGQPWTTDTSTGQVTGGQPMVTTGLEEDPHAPKDPNVPISDPSNYQSKVTDPTGMGGEEAGLAPILSSFGKMHVYEEPARNPKTGPGPGPAENEYTGTHNQFAPENPDSVPKVFGAGKHEDMPRDTLTGKPTDQSYTGKLTSTTSAIVDKAISAKNVVATKLGYGGGDKEHAHAQEVAREGDASKSTPPMGYGQKIAATVTEKLAPVYGKVTGTGSSASGGPDKGVSVKEYWSEKLKPGEEDRALSQVISDVIHKRKEEAPGNPPAPEEVEKPMGRVTESEEVARRLGTGSSDTGGGGEGATAEVSGSTSTGKGVVDRIKGWLRGPGEPQHGNPTIEGLNGDHPREGNTGTAHRATPAPE